MRRKFFKHNKYKNKRCLCKQNHKHDSRAEARYCDMLALLKKAKEIKDYEIQKTFPLKFNGEKITSHRVDFLVTTKNGKQEVREYKGFATKEWKIKKRMFEVLYPDIPYIVIEKHGGLRKQLFLKSRRRGAASNCPHADR